MFRKTVQIVRTTLRLIGYIMPGTRFVEYSNGPQAGYEGCYTNRLFGLVGFKKAGGGPQFFWF